MPTSYTVSTSDPSTAASHQYTTGGQQLPLLSMISQISSLSRIWNPGLSSFRNWPQMALFLRLWETSVIWTSREKWVVRTVGRRERWHQFTYINFLYTLQVLYEEGQEYAAQIRAGFFETSAKDGTNIQQMFGSIGRARHIFAHFFLSQLWVRIHMVPHCVIRTLCQVGCHGNIVKMLPLVLQW